MAKVTSRLQLTIPRAVAEKYSIRPGDELAFEPAGDVIRVAHASHEAGTDEGNAREMRLRLFDQATKRQQRRNIEYRRRHGSSKRRFTSRGWKREDLYPRGRAR
jgi:bifunctional DNA-binding transcriptional regulator/antitoxin component of YhaV-PrlF toxin-antitoxin module